ncbi:MAG: hypothetical protein IPK50_18305 [Fibrobacterota bacterium]|nr:hypothetical protein [Fibrobacterota bacterium]QQS04223.1 MAG: hypothetical protein IPK50_18305 [Fibrobacterota bacterium]
MKLSRNGRILTGSVFAAIALQSCQDSASIDAPTAAEAPKAAARASIPNNLASVTPWVLSDYETITYYLEGSYSTSPTNRASAVEAFKEWSLVLQDGYSRIRFQETTDRDFANIRVASVSGSAISGGCVEGTRVRYCDLLLPNINYLLKGIGMVMGIPVSSSSGDVMYSSNTGSIFSEADLSMIASKYNLAKGALTPVFEIPYFNATGTEVVIGWNTLRSRTVAGPVYVKKSLADRKLHAGAMGAGLAGYWSYSATYSILSYVKTHTYGAYAYYSAWNYADQNYSTVHPAGMTGGDPAPGVLGYAGCVDNSQTRLNSFGTAPELFAFNPATIWIGGYYSRSAAPAKYAPGTTVPVYFYKDVTTARFRVSTTLPTTNATCARLGGYGFAVN